MLKFSTSDPIRITPYDPQWPQVFNHLKQNLERLWGDWAERIDHIGSTAVPGMAAKNVIDIQITVKSLENPDFNMFLEKLAEHSPVYTLLPYNRDELSGFKDNHPGLKKRFIKALSAEFTANIHIRQAGNINQRYALLFVAFLKEHSAQREIYSLLKQRLANLFPESIAGYLHIKDPLMDLLYLQAEAWAEYTGWKGDWENKNA